MGVIALRRLRRHGCEADACDRIPRHEAMVDGKELHVTDKAGNEVATPPVRIVVDGGARGKGVVLRR